MENARNIMQKIPIHRERIVRNEDGSVEASKSKFNSKYILGNLLVCEDCGTSYRRRTERGKVLWRCATRIEKGKNECALFPTLNEEWLKEQFTELICDGSYDEGVVKNKVDRIEVYNGHILVKGYDGSNIKVCLQTNNKIKGTISLGDRSETRSRLL